jgi:hypothetical protein
MSRPDLNLLFTLDVLLAEGTLLTVSLFRRNLASTA